MAYSQNLLKKLSSFQYRNLTMHTCHMIMSDLLCVSSDCVEWAHCKTQNGLWNGLIPRTQVKVCFDLMPKLPLHTLSKYMNTTGNYNAVVVYMI